MRVSAEDFKRNVKNCSLAVIWFMLTARSKRQKLRIWLVNCDDRIRHTPAVLEIMFSAFTQKCL